ncbi:pteridine-dependent deoxygenase [Chiayiivirga flava]|uniref:chorismate transformation enzyme, FkbO/Hyg5 family n=1 Tax=Chiayiivirga flava TaxID=659595 RepID=UPI00161D7F87|nr:pteridine-dependent deoxygenase [Chiayiivirga flava]
MSALQVRHSGDAAALLRFGTAGEMATLPQVTLYCTPLAGPTGPEAWFDTGTDAALRVVSIEVREADGDIEAAAAEAYRRLLAQVRPSSHPYMVRVWNYLDAINAGSGDEERYRRFCVGRAAAVDAMFNDPPPAATAIGNTLASGVVQVVALCATTPPLALENPRQTPAWRYPRDYGPVPPGFSRGALVGVGAQTRLLASGTASIVGHVSQHVGDAAAQARESLANLDVLLQEGSRRSGLDFALTRHEALRVYLRDAADLAAVQAALAARLPLSQVWFLQGDVCRRELLVELEGVFAPG